MKVKSQFASIVFTGMFGPFGLFYSSSIAAIIMIILWVGSAVAIVGNAHLNSLGDLIQFIRYGDYLLWILIIYVVSIIVGMFTVVNYNDNFTNELEALIDQKISTRNQVWTDVEIDAVKAKELGVVGLRKHGNSYVFSGAEMKALHLLKYEVKAELQPKGFSDSYDISNGMRMQREEKAIQMEFSFKDKIIKINLENMVLPIAIEKYFVHEKSEAVNSNGLTTEKVFCTKCGKENNSDAKFCTSCGSGIDTNA
jgi:ABC-type multidrug transport system fused ATPase/permease subunit